VSIPATRTINFARELGGIYEPLETTRSDDFLSCERSEDARDDLVRGIFVVLLELVIFRDLFSARGMIEGGSK
jgi:hypothetical protein